MSNIKNTLRDSYPCQRNNYSSIKRTIIKCQTWMSLSIQDYTSIQSFWCPYHYSPRTSYYIYILNGGHKIKHATFWTKLQTPWWKKFPTPSWLHDKSLILMSTKLQPSETFLTALSVTASNLYKDPTIKNFCASKNFIDALSVEKLAQREIPRKIKCILRFTE